jgi:hypothetical protein
MATSTSIVTLQDLDLERHALEIMASSFEFTAKPCDNFYKFVCGRWANASGTHEMMLSSTESYVRM